MKHLKRFNEELSSNTYSRAADKLYRMSKNNQEFKKRSDAMYDHRDIQGIKAMIADYGKYGKTTITTQINEKGDTVTGEFYLIFDFDSFIYEDNHADYVDDNKISINFSIGFIPVDIETRQKFSVLPDDDFENGFFWGAWITLDFDGSDDSFVLDKVELHSYDYGISGRVSFTRQLCSLIKKHLVNCFIDGDYKLNDGSMYNSLEEEVLIKTGDSSKYGIEMSNLHEIVSKITPNKLMASVSDKDKDW